MIIPTVLEQSKYGERAFDLYSRMMEDRIVFINGQINEQMSNIVTASLLFMENKAPGSPIQMFINSPGGDVDAGYAIYDTMTYITSPVVKIGMGRCASMGQFLLSSKSGREGEKRLALPNTRIMQHQPSGGAGNQCSDIVISAKELVKMKEKFINYFVKWSKQPLETIKKDIERDYWMNPQEALEYGYIDEILYQKEVKTDTTWAR
jgi:ATP-dependent Clp protease protease subunit